MPLSAEAALETAGAVLSRREGRAVTLSLRDTVSGESARNLVLRAADAAGRTVILKATRDVTYDPAATDGFGRFGLVREWAAVRLLAERGAAEAALLGGDAERGLLVFADLGRDLPTLARPLLDGTAAEAEAALCAHAAALGRLHAATRDCRAAHAASLHEAFPAIVRQAPGDWIARIARPVLATFGGAAPEAELTLIADRLAATEGWLALVHGDPCPDNVLLRDGAAILIDYEFAGPGHALFDAMCCRMGFPTCWCAGAVPKAVLARAEASYRAALAEADPAAGNDGAFACESAILCAAWLFEALSLPWLGGHTPGEDRIWGRATTRSRVLHYLQAAHDAAEAADTLPGLRRLMAEWQDRLREAWPQTTPLAPFPAFASKAGD